MDLWIFKTGKVIHYKSIGRKHAYIGLCKMYRHTKQKKLIFRKWGCNWANEKPWKYQFCFSQWLSTVVRCPWRRCLLSTWWCRRYLCRHIRTLHCLGCRSCTVDRSGSGRPRKKQPIIVIESGVHVDVRRARDGGPK